GYGYGWGGWGWGFGYGWPYWGYGWGYPYGYYGYGSGYYAPYSYSYSSPSDGYSEDYIGDYPPDPSDYDDGRNTNQRRAPNYGPNHNYGPAPNRRPQYNNGNGNRPPANPNQQPQTQPNQLDQNEQPQPPATPPAPGATGNVNYNRGVAENVPPRPRVLSVDPMMATPAAYRVTPNTVRSANGDGAGARSSAPLRPEMQRAMERLRNMPPFAREREIESGRYGQFSAADKQLLRNGQ
ncbi:MAG TPA: hypothetical protein VNH19_03425, partial [Candidatus Limnocylindrales bacterium]|nr:hypothetical protein [Candidatus Limnocylindrales bacterium]